MTAARAIAMLIVAMAAGCTGAGEPPLDVPVLKARLGETPVIGLFTRLALRNEADDLVQRFRAHHRDGGKADDDASLRQSYNMLVLKALALIQDGDPSLARTLSGSRETIWGILADPEKFKSAT
jgi:hypothetical protein